MVEDVEELRPETKPHLLGDVKLPLHSGVGLPGSETSENVASKIALLSVGCGCESRAIENSSARILRSLECERQSRVDVRSGSKAETPNANRCANHVNRWSGSGKNKTVQRPTVQDRFDKLLRSRRGQIVSHG